MNHFYASVEIILPLFVIMLLGYFTKQFKWISDAAVNQFNHVVFRLFLPIMICVNIMDADIRFEANPAVFVYVAAGIFLLFLLAWLIVPLFEKDNRKKAAMIQGIGRGNYVLFGVPVVKQLCEDATIASLLVVVVVPLFNVLSVIVLERYRGGQVGYKKIVRGIVTNPLIIGSVVGFLLLKLQLPLPVVLTKPMRDIAGMATPLALFLLGSSFQFSKVGQNTKRLLWIVLGKLVFAPVLFVTVAVLLGFRGAELVAIMVVFAAPAAVNSFTMAQQMDADAELAAQHIVFSTAFSVFTMFLFVFAGKQLALF